MLNTTTWARWGIRGVAAIGVFMAIGCGGSGTAPSTTSTTTPEGFNLRQHSAQMIDATYQAGGAYVHFTAVESSTKVVDVTYDFGSPVIAFHVDYLQGKGEFIPAGGTLDASQQSLMDGLLPELSMRVAQDEGARTAVENASLRQTMFMQIVPVGEALQPYGFVSERGWTYISCTCSYQWDGHSNWEHGGKGCSCTGGSGNGCKGRCGGGCMQDGASINAYTQDCLCHDYGLCSWTTASDDFAFAASNCGATTGCY